MLIIQLSLPSSCTTGKNLSALHSKIEEVLASESHLGEFLPKVYLELERMVIQVPASSQILSDDLCSSSPFLISSTPLCLCGEQHCSPSATEKPKRSGPPTHRHVERIQVMG